MKILLSLLTALLISAPSMAKNNLALDDAISWLKLVDEQQYSQSWQASAPVFQSSVTDAQWSQALNQVRLPLGELISRQVQNIQDYTSLPSLPDGEYKVITMSTSFANKPSAVETISVQKLGDNWRVIGYFIK
jgi:hypothetical protein